jgi:hypothetical protein
MLKTLAARHKSTVATMAARHKAKVITGDGPRTWSYCQDLWIKIFRRLRAGHSRRVVR